ncbi:MAG: hypothetical protein IJ868_09440 [Prevotella sp.]|nr:hypothetical protein [Prevotella sp.]
MEKGTQNASGNRNNGDGSGIADRNVGSNGNYWSSTDGTGSKAFNWNFNSGNMNENFNAQGYAFSVRLFREESVLYRQGVLFV